MDQLSSEHVQRVLFSYGEFREKSRPLETWFMPFKEILIDSGAFSHGKSGMRVSIEAYASFLDSVENSGLYPWASAVKSYVNFDVMSDPEQTWENQQKLESKGLHPMPVFHLGEDEAWLDRYCASYEYVGLGGLAIGQVNTATLKIFWDGVAQRFPDNKFHMLGTNQLRAFIDNEPYSIDATTWIADSWGHLVTVAKDGGPAIGKIMLPLNEDSEVDKHSHRALSVKKTEIAQHFFTADELRRNNIRALLYFEKMEWVAGVRKEQKQLSFGLSE